MFKWTSQRIYGWRVETVSLPERSATASGRAISQGFEEYLLRSADGRHFSPGMRIDYTRGGSVCAIAEADIPPR